MEILEALTNKIKQKEDLIKVYKKDNKKSISFSTLNTVETCYRLYKFQYVDRVSVESDNIYTYLGSKAHSIIEQLYRGEINNKQAIKLWDDSMNNTSLLFVNYDKIENEEVKKDLKHKNDLYKNNYNKNMKHYFFNFKSKFKPNSFLQEKTVMFELKKFFKNNIFKDYYFKGIVDFINVREDGSLDIIDYKTSTIYKNNKLVTHSYQLILYAIALEDMGFKINSLGWNFLKYVRKKKVSTKSEKYFNVERKTLKDIDIFEDCIINIDYTSESKLKALKYLYSNLLNIIKLESFKNINGNKIPYNYNKFFCENLCSCYTICELGG